MKLPLSVSIITLNEEKNLERCLESVAALASEIVVIDSGSTDRTQEIAERFGAKFEYRKWPGHVKQKNHALSRCSQPWVLAIDADEALSEELQKELAAIFTSSTLSADGYWINRKTFYLGDWIRHAWYPEWRLRLVRRELGHWEGVDPHDRMTEPEKTGKLSGDLLHYSYKDLEDHLSRTIRYARIGAEAQIRKGGKFQWHKLAFSPWMRFLKALFVRQAWRDGWRGWIIAFSSMLTCFSKYAFMYEQERTENLSTLKKACTFSSGRRRITISQPFTENEALRNYLLNMESRFSTPEATFFKNDHAATVIALPIGGTPFVIKRYNPVSWHKDWRRALRKSRARKTWEHAVHLRKIGVHSVEPVALVEHKFGPFCLRASFISLYENGVNAQDFFRDPTVNGEKKKEAAGLIVRSLKTFHSSGIIHGDTKDTNILIDKERIVWLDLDAMHTRLPRVVRRMRQRKDWRLLLYNWKNYPVVQRFFIEELQLHIDRQELFQTLNELIRHRGKKMGSEIDDTDQPAGSGPAATIKLLQCAGIFVKEASLWRHNEDINPPEIGANTAKPLSIYLEGTENKNTMQWRNLMRQLGEEIGYLHGCGFVHGNLSFRNLSVSNGEKTSRFYFSDVSGVRHFKHFSYDHALNDLVKFNRDARRCLSRTDRLRMFSGYLTALGNRTDRKKWLTAIESRTGKTGAAQR